MKIFMLLSRVPFPLDKGDKLRAFNFLKYLSAKNEIYLCCLNDAVLEPDDVKEFQKYCKRIVIYKIKRVSIITNLIKVLFNGKPFQVGYFYNANIQNNIYNLISEIKPEHIICQLIRTSDYVKNIDIAKTLDFQDVLSYGAKRRIDFSPFYMKFILKLEYKRLMKYEHDIFDFFNHKIIISEPDKLLIPHDNKQSIDVIKNGLDNNYYHPQNIEKEYDVIFSGNMAYPPNVIAAECLINEILPIVKISFPDIKILIAGANPTNKVKRLASKNVEISGWVDDMRDCYAISKIFIAPMRIGTGLQNKLLEAMAMKLPCITTPLANDSLGANVGKDILVGTNANELSQHICSLMNDNNLYKDLSENARKFVLKNYNWETEIRKLENIISNKNKPL